MGLGPFDEVRNDQEVARKAHLGDDAQFIVQARLIISDGRGGRMGGETGCKPLPGLGGPFLRLGTSAHRRKPR